MAGILQLELVFPVLSDDEVRRRLDPNDPKCAFHGYFGNGHVVEELMDLAYSGFQHRMWDNGREVCCRRIPKRLAFLGPASSGKTTAARLLAKTMGLPYCEVEPLQIAKPETLFALLSAAYEARGLELEPLGLVDGVERYCLPAGVLVIDEVHLLSPRTQDSLLKMTEAKDSVLRLKDKVVDCRYLCIIICTTDRGKLRPAFKTRFRQITLLRHTVTEVSQIVKWNNKDWSDQDCTEIARLKPLPREALDFADTVKLIVGRRKVRIAQAIQLAARREGICESGVTRTALRVLSILSNQDDGMARKSICASLEIEEEEFVNDCLPCLLETDRHPAFVAIGYRHKITPAGVDFISRWQNPTGPAPR